MIFYVLSDQCYYKNPYSVYFLWCFPARLVRWTGQYWGRKKAKSLSIILSRSPQFYIFSLFPSKSLNCKAFWLSDVWLLCPSTSNYATVGKYHWPSPSGTIWHDWGTFFRLCKEHVCIVNGVFMCSLDEQISWFIQCPNISSLSWRCLIP